MARAYTEEVITHKIVLEMGPEEAAWLLRLVGRAERDVVSQDLWEQLSGVVE